MDLSKTSKQLPRPIKAIVEFMRLESSSGIMLFVMAVLALVVANSPWHDGYHEIFHYPIAFQIGQWHASTTLIFWINDLLMAIFFFLVGLEIKREILQGELNSIARVSLPAIAALGGIVMPAIIYVALNWHDGVAMRGWAIPTATDIAFALGIMVLLGDRVPITAKLFLMALAIFDDIAAIVIIALFYTADLSWLAMSGAFIALLVAFAMNRWQVTRLFPYIVVGMAMWGLLLVSGIHPTIGGVLLALAIPLGNQGPERSPLLYLEKTLHPWVAYAILPVFCFANAGVSFAGMPLDELFSHVPLGIILGLFVGKQLGIFSATWLAVKLGWAPMPKGTNWMVLYGVALVCGVGFTMSLFIGNLAFTDPTSDYPALVRFGVFLGSSISGVVGYLFIRFGHRSR
ncbi:MAG: nhaA [Gammaproteobacteria bacterium]|jgi:NhaA family Na+:H+ antiporter|nr:nhaA [Gammaproteobacteria bacterium]